MKEYPSKILLAWSEAIKGNEAIADWLIQNGFAELVMFIRSLKGSREADKWLFENNFPEYVAAVEYINGKKEAGDWLDKYHMTVLKMIADTAIGVKEAEMWLMHKKLKEVVIVAIRLRHLVEEMDRDLGDVHKPPFR